MAVGRRPDEPDDDRFNMAVMGLRLAGRSNGVAQLHGAVSREMFQGMWPDVTVEEVPIGAITNGVHAHTWVSTGVANLLAESVGPVWDGADEASWAGVAKLSPADIWATRAKGRATLVSFVRSKFGESLLDPHALTIGFARRFATYKRATLLLSQPDRLRRLLLDTNRPVQFVFAGKAHPADQPGKDMIRQIELFARQLDGGSRVVFLQDYDMAVARTMLHGCDVWLNNPRRPLEACGTSGMKAALNGVLNCSILDGWWNECYDGTNGWAVASADDDPDQARRDQREATSLFGLLEREIVPLFYDRDANGIPLQWIDKMKQNWRTLGPFVTAARMVRQYTSQLYEPAATSAGCDARRQRRSRQGVGSLEATHQRTDGPTSKWSRSTSTPRRRTKATSAPVRARVELGGLDARRSDGAGTPRPDRLRRRVHLHTSHRHAAARRRWRVRGRLHRRRGRPLRRHRTADSAQRRPDQPDGDGPRRLGRLVRPSLSASAPGELGFARAVLEEAAHPDLTVGRVEHSLEQVSLQLQRSRKRLVDARVDGSLDHRLGVQRAVRHLGGQGEGALVQRLR